MPGLRWQYHTFTPDPVFVTGTGVTPDPTVASVIVVSFSKTLALTLTPVVASVLVVAPTITIGVSDVWVDTWGDVWIDTWGEVFV